MHTEFFTQNNMFFFKSFFIWEIYIYMNNVYMYMCMVVSWTIIDISLCRHSFPRYVQ